MGDSTAMNVIALPRRPAARPWWLSVLRGPFGPQAFYLGAGAHVVGGAWPCDVSFGAGSGLTHGVAPHELALRNDGDTLRYAALPGARVELNGARGTGGTLEEGDILRIGAGSATLCVTRDTPAFDVPETLASSAVLMPDGTLFDAPLRAGDTLIGRAPECDVVIDHPSVAPHHALIRSMGPLVRVLNLHPSIPIRIGDSTVGAVHTFVREAPGPIAIEVGAARIFMAPPRIWPAASAPRDGLGRWAHRTEHGFVVSHDPYGVFAALVQAAGEERAAVARCIERSEPLEAASVDCKPLVAPCDADRAVLAARPLAEPWLVLLPFVPSRPLAPRRALIDGPELRSLLRQALGTKLARARRRRRVRTVRAESWIPLVGS
ncbi:MAG: FHA domain-containing protein [Myxococcales bacterium]|nr:FHA domain-containing protein [Myxococcales bacterium]